MTKMFKKVFAFVLAVVMCVVATSCTVYEKATINKNGSVTHYSSMRVKKSDVKAVKDLFHNPDKPYFDEDTDSDLYDQICEWEAEMDVKEIDGVKYYFEEFTDKDCTLSDLTYNYISSQPNGAGEITTTGLWAYTPDTVVNDDTQTMLKIFEELGIEYDASAHLTFPYKITATNCEKVDDYTINIPLDQKIWYVVTEESREPWALAEDKEAEITAMALETLKPIKSPYLRATFESAKRMLLVWETENFDDKTGAMYFYGNGSQVQVRIGKGEWKTIKTLDEFEMGVYSYKFIEGKTYQFRVRSIRKSPSGAFETMYSSYKLSRKVTIPYFSKCPYGKVVSKSKGAITVSFKKPHNIKSTGYQIRYSTDKKFKKGVKTISVKTKNMPKTIKKLKSGKTYFVKIRKYQKPGYDGYTFNVYGKWSKTFRVKVK